ncbi:aldehyde dehydrogenase family protein [Streptomyces sp. Go-475]|uniref:aldehyde dehydrogenase family protein n=1 Tax=Streptomyces sp. Go-475 TaxID=2072505 RepID=UPI000DF02AA7|nr:aldehyde dehydrogenase family protein [Streptomyces sp. Go-475]AXE90239.1 Succinate-semialdehyde dehydrogenase [NADP(+)] 1 [Streptomyces sp. Go-475]
MVLDDADVEARLLTGGKPLPGDAVRLANATPYGLGLSVWTADPGRGVALARRITSGAAFVNAIVASDPRLPFGGTKRSGHGREPAAVGIREFTNTRTYWVAA